MEVLPWKVPFDMGQLHGPWCKQPISFEYLIKEWTDLCIRTSVPGDFCTQPVKILVWSTDPSVSKSNRLHVCDLSVFLYKLESIFHRFLFEMMGTVYPP